MSKHIAHLLTVFFFAKNIFAWGFIGHKQVAIIAKQHLTPTTIQKLLPIQHKDSLEQLSIWPDTVRNYYPNTINWHYITIPNIPTKQLDLSNKNGQLYQQLCNNIKALTKNNNAHWQEKHQALSWVIHLVGDAHQPLHAGNGKDFGGNTCKIKWHKRKKPISLHKVWDNYLVKAAIKTNNNINNKSQFNQQLLIAPPTTWLIESRKLHSVIYPANPTTYCNSNQTIPKLGKDYTKKMTPIVSARISIAGQRLAYLLNYIFDQNFKKNHAPIKQWQQCSGLKL